MASSAIMRLLPQNVSVSAGHVKLDGDDLLSLNEAQMRKVRGAQIAMVFQEPMTALNPIHTLGHQIGEMLRVHTRLTRREAADKGLALQRGGKCPDRAEREE